MTRYTVVWVESALDDLARFWIKTVHRQAISDSADLADEYLATDAHLKGESLAEGLLGRDGWTRTFLLRRPRA